jgi:hypothetical protein
MPVAPPQYATAIVSLETNLSTTGSSNSYYAFWHPVTTYLSQFENKYSTVSLWHIGIYFKWRACKTGGGSQTDFIINL